MIVIGNAVGLLVFTTRSHDPLSIIHLSKFIFALTAQTVTSTSNIRKSIIRVPMFGVVLFIGERIFSSRHYGFDLEELSTLIEGGRKVSETKKRH